jgi:serine protease
LPAGTSQASVQLEAGEEAGSATLDVTLRAGDFPDRDALVVFVFPDEQGELDATDDTATVARAAEGYRYSLRLPPNTYFAIAGIDDDRDDVYFEQGERIGFWRNQDNPVEIVLAAGQTVSGIDFDLIPEVTLAATPPASQARPIPLR